MMNGCVGQVCSSNADGTLPSNEDVLSLARTDMEKVLGFELAKLKDEMKQRDAAYYETKAQRDIFQEKYSQLCLRIDDLVKVVHRCKYELYKPEVKTISLSESALTSVFESLKSALIENQEKENMSQNIISLRKEKDDEMQRLKQQNLILCNEQEEVKIELESSKAHAFSLLQKLSCARSELIASEENHRKKISSTTSNFELEKQNIEKQVSLLKLERDELSKNFMGCNNDLSICQRSQNELTDEVRRLKESLRILQNDELKNESFSSGTKHTMESLDNKFQAQKLEKDADCKHLEKECDRLRKHLVAMEERYTMEALDAEAQREELTREVEGLRSELADSKTSARDIWSDSSKQLEGIVSKLKECEEEKAEFRRRWEESEKLVSRYSSSIENLHSVLEQYEKNQQLMQLAELEKCRQDLRLETARSQRLTQQYASLENEHGLLKTQLSEMTDSQEKLKLASTHINYYQLLVSERDENIRRLAKELDDLRADDSAKVDKVMMRNMLMGYLHAPSSKKKEAFSIIGRFLDFSKEEFSTINTSGSWTSYLKQQYSPIDHPSEVQPQSFFELFVKFLEKESRPTKDPVLNLLMESQEHHHQDHHHHYNHLPHGRSESTHEEPIHRFLQSLKQQMDISASPTNRDEITTTATTITGATTTETVTDAITTTATITGADNSTFGDPH